MPATSPKEHKNTTSTTDAANDSFWSIKAFASIAVMGLSALIWWQFEQGTPAEQEAVKTAQPSPATAAIAPKASPATAPAPAPLPSAAADTTAKATTQKRIQERPQVFAQATKKPAPMIAESAAPSAQSERARSQDIASATPAPQAAPAPLAAAQSKAFPPPSLLQAIQERNAAALRQALSEGASPNARTPEGNPALTQAVIQRWADGVRILLSAGANKEAKSSQGHTAIDVAQELGHQDIIELLKAAR